VKFKPGSRDGTECSTPPGDPPRYGYHGGSRGSRERCREHCLATKEGEGEGEGGGGGGGATVSMDLASEGVSPAGQYRMARFTSGCSLHT
jgi:hypothetical protein